MPATVLRVVGRGLISFVTLLILARLLGKQQLGQLSFFEYITGITIGSMAAALTVNLTEQGWVYWVGLVTWTGLTLLVQFLALKSRRAAKTLAGDPDVVIARGQILEDALRRNRYRYDELLAQLRRQSIFDVREVEFAVLETSGELSVLRKSADGKARHLPAVVVQEGVICADGLRASGHDEAWLWERLKARGIDALKEVTVAMVTPDGDLYVDIYEDREDHGLVH